MFSIQQITVTGDQTKESETLESKAEKSKPRIPKVELAEFEQGILYHIKDRSEGVAGDPIHLNSRILTRVCPDYSKAFTKLESEGHININRSYKVGDHSMTYSLTEAEAKLGFNIKYEDVKSTMEKMKDAKQQYRAYQKKQNQKKLCVLDADGKIILEIKGEEEKTDPVWLLAEEKGVQAIFNSETYRSFEYHLSSGNASGEEEREIKLLNRKRPVLKQNGFEIITDSNDRRYTPLTGLKKTLRKRIPGLYEADFTSSNYQMLYLLMKDVLGAAHRNQWLEEQSEEIVEKVRKLAKETESLYADLREGFYEKMLREMKTLSQGTRIGKKISKLNRSQVKKIAVRFLGYKNKHLVKREGKKISKIMVYSETFKKLFPTMHELTFSIKKGNHGALCNILMSKESEIKKEIMIELIEDLGFIPSIASIHDSFLSKNGRSMAHLEKILKGKGLLYKLERNPDIKSILREDKRRVAARKKNLEIIKAAKGVKGFSLRKLEEGQKESNRKSERGKTIEKSKGPSKSTLGSALTGGKSRKGFRGALQASDSFSHMLSSNPSLSLEARLTLLSQGRSPPPPNILKSKQVLSRQSDEVNSTPECKVVSSSPSIVPEIDNYKGYKSEGFSYESKRQLELLRLIEDM